ncbi:polyribonucleotide nucleotidyltransferase [Candidatus Giovannonibacteria bacterium RIFCSPLOWO2_02_FULL_45_14]|uniref:Polyribonucleotide nucleotidyltransferase n=1 Tax=Candidatus Giovannonibacteria bacterium RIFCSPLOWO2_12_FULL_44_15 TaxID=1798364 RepID=A0A1F5Y095_9BACT|nr:MAG: polyribonucleotide nucleotidyltransferase [Candidatus Giovannonibacteria bacterium RIFCSPHIGHO2_02_FULL_44_31]OGF76217.1 MAG: polyribonucleotide nucleotidyltransferase [Candidatus Giovannonibacteria bacterium RIFCSPHIGHO2_12_FULL_44_29]OGF91114.1 MAG: polyribonucleotide nucleotidyltransferase [Candidatus Giovannonibacteria bacterium RIFCSPLOWO2_02_FULL_45_14]OGF93574.1 MAG: polyribonucleotide nucleotidyltransferase [Candidatus Giovannonibacteria bacterium RIFCSPLOWO2_12_FULL_44_15]
MNSKKFTTDFGGKELTVEFNDLAEQAHGSAMVRLGDTVILATAVMSQGKREGIDYFPLSVDYEERFYAAGKILGSRFVRREGRPSEEGVLVSRLIDRGLRPLFNHKIRNEVHVVALALSVDQENEPDVVAILAASLALGTSSIPWDGPIGAVRVGKVGGKFVLNPIRSELEKSDLDMVVCGKDGKINMVEAGAKEIPEEEMLEALAFAQKEIDKIEEFQKKIAGEMGREKIMPALKDEPEKISEIFEKDFREKLEKAIYIKDKKERNVNLFKLKEEWDSIIANDVGADYSSVADGFYEEKIDEIVHKNILVGDLRPDGRGLKELRSLWAGVGILPRTHGSGLFYRGETHVLSAATLGGPGDTQLVEGMSISTKKRFMHHYNFPPFAPGETGRMGGPGRREIGHGALAERALIPVLPDISEFPYVIRLVSEVLSSNGSTSMASTCASILSMMDAGVPIKRMVAGIAMGLILSPDGKKFKVLTDIQGPEDHYGDMDFKSAGTSEGVTAVQMDVKISGVTLEVLKETLLDARAARIKIMEVMARAIDKPRAELSKFAPRILTIKINPDRIRDLIGPGGKMINSIIDETGATVDVEQDGTVFITGSAEGSEKALARVKEVTHEFEVGEVFEGTVSRIFDFGAMVEIAPKQEGLVHISELAPFRVERVTDMVDVGDKVKVKIKSIDELGRVNLSIKDVAELKPKVREPGWSPREDRPRGPGGRRERGGGRFRR